MGARRSASTISSASSNEVDGAAAVPRRSGRHSLDAEKARLRAPHRLRHRAARRASRDARLPLRAVRAGRAQAPDAALRDARGRGRPAAPRGRPGRPAARSSARAPGVGRELLDQADREVLHARPRGTGHATPGSSIVAFEKWLKRAATETILDGIARYNRDDCVSTWMLRDWLEGRAPRRSPHWPELDWQRPVTPADRADARPSNGLAAGRRERCRRPDRRPAGPDDRSDEASRPLAARPAARLAPPRGEVEVVALVRPAQEPRPRGARRRGRPDRRSRRSSTSSTTRRAHGPWRYRFQPQDHELRRRRRRDPTRRPASRPGRSSPSTTPGGDRSSSAEPPDRAWPHPAALIPIAPLDCDRGQKAALLRLADAVIADGIEATGRYRAVRDTSCRRPPRRPARPRAQPLVEPGEDELDAARRLALALDHGDARRSRDRPGRARPTPGRG